MGKTKRASNLGPLRSALETARESRSLAQIASESRVSTKTLALVREGTPVAAGATLRVRAGWSESLTRLAVHLKVKPGDALAEFGLSVGDGDVRTGIERALRSVSRPQMVPDRALGDIELRMLSNESVREVLIGILNWPPFYEGRETSGFAEPFIRRLVQAVNPYWRSDPIEEIATIDQAISGLVADPPEYDLVFGLYDTSYRREQGLDFIPVPGLFIELGAIAARPLTWRQVIDPPEQKPHALVLKEEAGFHLLRGACDYKERLDITVADNHDYRRLAAQLIWLWKKYRSRDVLLVVDANTCKRVLAEIADRERWLPFWREYADHGAEPPVVAEVRDFSMVGGGQDSSWVPRFPVCIAVRSDSPRFRELLTAAMRADLFNHARLATARLYQRLRETPGAEHLKFDGSTFQQLGEDCWKRFDEAWREVLAHVPRRDGGGADVPPWEPRPPWEAEHVQSSKQSRRKV